MRGTKLHVTVVLATICAVCATETQKRAPSGFTGVRGKKSIPDTAYNTDSSQITDDLSSNDLKSGIAADISDKGVLEKRAPSGFMGMRGKKPFTQQAWSSGYPDDVLYKRAPSGFLGMRGKKDFDLNNYEEYLKRAPSGFMGMRGKKESDFSDLDYDSSTYLDKRAPMGFMGMRGKKDYESIINDAKRAPAAGFFGMRGKKQPGRSGFFGMRGKKYPYEFRGKFVGVRGKKMLNEVNGPDYYSNNLSDDEIAHFGEGLDINQLMLLLTESDGGDGVSWEKAKSEEYWPQQLHE